MNDKNGNPIAVGDRVLFRCMDKTPIYGVVRDIRLCPYGAKPRTEARCDDGDPANDDYTTNGFARSSWVTSKNIELAPPDEGAKRLARAEAEVARLRRLAGAS